MITCLSHWWWYGFGVGTGLALGILAAAIMTRWLGRSVRLPW